MEDFSVRKNFTECGTYAFFWDGVFSQWHPSKISEVQRDGTTLEFNCAEQYMMYGKAILFGDVETADKIMSVRDPRVQKQMGRIVKNFDKETWDTYARTIVFRGNLLKFTQNQDLLNELMLTRGLTLVEASPYDDIWGIGIHTTIAVKTPPGKWLGTNWLGLELTNVRTTIEKMKVDELYERLALSK